MQKRHENTPRFEWKNLNGTSEPIKLNMTVSDPPIEVNSRELEEFHEQVLKKSQQIIFLPYFKVSDHMFYGEKIDSSDPKDGFPTLRIAHINGINFHLQLMENFNDGDLDQSGNLVNLFGTGTNGNHIGAYAINGVCSPLTAEWLDGVLTKIQDELMFMKPEPNTDEFSY